jgi:hypothetical protein
VTTPPPRQGGVGGVGGAGRAAATHPPTGGGLTSLSGDFSKLFTDLKDGASRAPSLPPRYPLQRLHSMALDDMEIQRHFSLLRAQGS